jgi:hypothetical protein
VKDIQLNIHTHKNLYLNPCSWSRAFSVIDVENAEKIPQALQGVRLDEFDSFAATRHTDAKYVGVCHYRRRPLFVEPERCVHPKIFIEPTKENIEFICSEKQRESALEILESHDVIQYRPCYLAINYRQQFEFFTPVRAWDIMIEILSDLGMRNSIGFYKISNAHVWATLFVANKEIFNSYADFAINVAKLLFERDEMKNLLKENNRLIPLLLERLTPFWVFHNKLKSAFVPMLTLEKDI